MICPHCHTENRDGAKFCDECGSRLPQGDARPLGHASSAKLKDLPLISATGFGMGTAVDAPVAGEEAPADKAALDPAADVDAAVPEADGEGEAGAEEQGPCAEGEPSDDAAPEQQADDEAEQAVAGAAEDADADESVDEGAEQAEAVEAPQPADEPSEPASADATQVLDLAQIGKLEFEAEKTQNLGPRPASPELPQAVGADLSGFDEFLVYPGYMPPKAAWHAGDTMEMPRITDADVARRTEFIAPDNDKKHRRKKDKKQDKRASEAKLGDAACPAPEAASASHAADKAVKAAAPKKPEGGKGKLIAAIVAAVILVGAGSAAAVTYHLEMWGGKVVPDVTGMTQSDATYLLQNKGFAVRTTQVASDAAEGLVLLMDPGAGARQEEGAEVVIHVSTARTVPSVVGSSQDAALKAFSDNGFENVSVATELSDEPEGTVLSVDPGEGTKAKASTPITLTVAQPYTVPDVSGMTPREAAAAIEDAGLSSTVGYVYDETVSEGSIIGIEPSAGSKVTSDTTVIISVAKSRASELEAAARSYLTSTTLKATDGSAFTVTSVDSVAYRGSNTVAFTASGRGSTSVTVLGQTLSVSGDTKQITGSVTFDSSNNVTGVSFS